MESAIWRVLLKKFKWGIKIYNHMNRGLFKITIFAKNYTLISYGK